MAKIIEVEANGRPYDEVCEHGIHFAGYNCVVCHPEKTASMAWLFSPEMDAAYAQYPTIRSTQTNDQSTTTHKPPAPD